MVFVFYQFNQAPIFFNEVGIDKVMESDYKEDFADIQTQYDLNFQQKSELQLAYATAINNANTTEAERLGGEIKKLHNIDIYKRTIAPGRSEQHYVNASKGLTLLWGVIAIAFANLANLFENLIQLVNIIGSLFYGTILGVFIVAFYLKRIKGNAVFISALISELAVIYIFSLDVIPYLWLNLIGCVLVVIFASILQIIIGEKQEMKSA